MDKTSKIEDKTDKKIHDAGAFFKGILKGDRYDEDERYKQNIETIYNKLKPIWVNECKDAIWLLQDEFIWDVAKIIYLDDQMGGSLDIESLSEEKRNLLGWKQVQAVIERYNAVNYSVVDTDSIKAILSSIIKDKNAKDSDRLKAIEMYTGMYSGETIEGITFVNDLAGKKFEKSKGEEDE